MTSTGQRFAGTGASGMEAGSGAQPAQDVEGPTALELASEHFHSRSFRLPGPRGGADHLVRVAWPRGAAPKAGFPALHLLDGRAAETLIDAPLLARLADAGGPAIVTHGYDVDTLYAMTERTRDYTPPHPGGGSLQDPMGRPGGAVDVYLDRLVRDILPGAEALAPLDPTRRTLWGHSYGGLCVLRAALYDRGGFARFVSASPSLWWNDSAFFRQTMALVDGGIQDPPRIDIHSGTAEYAPKARPTDEAVQRMIRMREAMPKDALDQLVWTLRSHDVPGQDLLFDGLDHGAAFRQSLLATIETAVAEL